MPFTSHARLADALLPALGDAASTILQIRDKGLVVEHKSDDSPVTEADRRAEAILSAALRAIHPEFPVAAEESCASGMTPELGRAYFLLDPLDGTRDYAMGRDDFTINIGLITDGRPVFGLIYAPAHGDLFVTTGAGEAVGAKFAPNQLPRRLAETQTAPLRVRDGRSGALTALVSQREQGPEFDSRLEALGIVSRTPVSSALKFGRLARGEADIYPRFGPTCEWDTAAGQAIVEAAGGTVTAFDGTALIYGKTSLGFLNGPFIARGRIEKIC